MAFRKGQKININKNLGKLSCYSSEEYYHGGSIGDVKLGSEGIIKEILNEKEILVRLNSGKTWYVHPDELKTNQLLIEALSGIESIETHPLLEMAEQNPIFVVDGKVYAGNEEVGTVASLDELAMSRIEPQLEQVRQNYFTQVWKEIGLENKLGVTTSDVSTLIDVQIFQYLRGEGYDQKIQGLVGQVLEKGKQKKSRKPNTTNTPVFDIAPLVSSVLEELVNIKSDVTSAKIWDVEETTKKRTKKQAIMDSLLGYTPNKEKTYEQGIIQAAVGREKFAIVNGEARYLVPYKRLPDVKLPNGKKFDFSNTVDLTTVNENYRRVISQLVRKQVLDTRFSEEEIQKVIEEKTKNLGRFAGKDKYSEADFGFVKSGSKFYVYLEIPSFNLNGRYSFQKSKIGIPISNNGNKLNYDEYIYRSVDGMDWKRICIGSAELPTRGDNKGEVVAKRLKQVRAMIFAGNSDDWYDSGLLGSSGFSKMYSRRKQDD